MMPSKHNQPNYNIRPAKHIERKMLCDAFHRLSSFGLVHSYRYVGFGSYYFRDFILFHKVLGITDMIDIERDMSNKPRYEFNAPFKCIRILFGEASDILPSLSFGRKKVILWLDYTKKLNGSMLGDLEVFCANALPGSVVVITVNARPTLPDEGKGPLNEMVTAVGEDRVPPGLVEKDFTGWGTAKISRRIIANEIQEALQARNGGLDPGKRFRYTQLFNFRYADGDKMLTVGGILYREGQEKLLAFEGLEFIRTGEEHCQIEVPGFTYREMRHIDRQLPLGRQTAIRLPGVPQEDLRKYEAMYRFFPVYADTDV
jgi:hypothetical protein